MNEGIDIIVATDCISYGLNMQFANNMIIMTMHFNPAKNQQRAGRIVRFGQDKKCTIYLLVTKDTIEESLVYKKIEGKINVSNSLMGYENKISISKSEIVRYLKKG